MRIAIFCSNYPPHTGGLEIVAQRVAEGLARSHEVTVITSAWDGATGKSTSSGVVVHRLPAVHILEKWGVPYPVPFGPGVRQALAAARSADLYHVHGALYASTVLAQLWAPRRIPLVLTEHVGFVRYRRPFLNWLQRAAWRHIGDRTAGRAAAVVVYNERVRGWLSSRYRSKALHFIGNGVDTDLFTPRQPEVTRRIRVRLGLPESEMLVLFVGRDAAKKNLESILEIPRHAFQLVVCGSDRRLQGTQILNLGVVPHEEMADLYACCDLMVLPSEGEGLPLAVQEAMASGLPVVLRWDDGYLGSLDRGVVAAYDTPDELEPLVLNLVQDGARRAKLASAARNWAEHRWSWANTVRMYEELFAQALESRRAHGNLACG